MASKVQRQSSEHPKRILGLLQERKFRSRRREKKGESEVCKENTYEMIDDAAGAGHKLHAGRPGYGDLPTGAAGCISLLSRSCAGKDDS